jgi:hydrogenase maturation protein HypF
MTTSMGRLFDAVASLLDVRQRITYEGQAAIELEVLAATEFHEGAAPGPELRLDVDPDGILDPTRMLATMVSALRDGAEPPRLAAAFHHAVAVAVTDVVGQVARQTRTVGLTGGVFQNVLLLNACRQLLEEAGFTVLTHRIVPPNDGGLALGQAAISALTALDEENTECV